MPVPWLQKSFFEISTGWNKPCSRLEKAPEIRASLSRFAANYHELDKKKLSSGDQGRGPKELLPD